MRTDSGYLLLAWDRFAIETSLWVGVLLILGLILVFSLVRIIWQGLLSLKPNWKRRGVRQLEQGILAFLELRLSRAKRLLRRGETHSPLPWVNQLLLARIAQTEDDQPTVAHWLEKATRQHPHLELPSGLLLVLSAYESHQLDLALAHCKRLEKNYPNNPFVIRLLRDIYVQLEDWTALLALQPRLIKSGRRTAEAWQTRMIQGLVKLAPEGLSDHLQGWWQQLTSAQQADAELRYQYCWAVTQSSPAAAAEKLIEKMLKQQFDSRLLVLYAALETPAKHRLQLAEKLAQQHPLDADMLLGLGRLCLQESLWGKAQDYFATGVGLSQRAELTLELARLERALGQHESSQKRLLNLAEELLKLPDLPLPKARPERLESVPESDTLLGARQV
jgi:HemY protein